MPAYKKKSTKSMKRPPISMPPSVVLWMYENDLISKQECEKYFLATDNYAPSVKKP